MLPEIRVTVSTIPSWVEKRTNDPPSRKITLSQVPPTRSSTSACRLTMAVSSPAS